MAKMKTNEDTPLIKQFFSVKAQYPEAVLLYRVGDFYESYSDDAVLVSKVLGMASITSGVMSVSRQLLSSAFVSRDRTIIR